MGCCQTKSDTIQEIGTKQVEEVQEATPAHPDLTQEIGTKQVEEIQEAAPVYVDLTESDSKNESATQNVQPKKQAIQEEEFIADNGNDISQDKNPKAQDQQKIQFNTTTFENSKILVSVYRKQELPNLQREISATDLQQGLLDFEDSTYIGTHYHGQPQGHGKMAYKNGDFYEGSFDKGAAHGKGEYKFKNGDVYEGEFFEGLYWGQGQLKSGDGRWIYKGEFVQGKFNGYGKFTSLNNLSFTGQFKDNKPLNSGTIEDLKNDCGEIYVGEHKNLFYHGQGCLKTKDGQIIFNGLWKNGQKVKQQ